MRWTVAAIESAQAGRRAKLEQLRKRRPTPSREIAAECAYLDRLQQMRVQAMVQGGSISD